MFRSKKLWVPSFKTFNVIRGKSSRDLINLPNNIKKKGKIRMLIENIEAKMPVRNLRTLAKSRCLC